MAANGETRLEWKPCAADKKTRYGWTATGKLGFAEAVNLLCGSRDLRNPEAVDSRKERAALRTSARQASWMRVHSCGCWKWTSARVRRKFG